MTIINQESLKERARALYTVPTEIPRETVDNLPVYCNTLLTSIYQLVNNQYILNQSVYSLTQFQRFEIIKCLEFFNGIKLLKATISGTQAILKLHFYNKNYLNDFVNNPAPEHQKFLIFGGHRIFGGSGTEQVQVTEIDPNNIENAILKLTVKPIGDYSTYTLSINTKIFPKIDPLFSEIDFKFRPQCFNIDCAPDWENPPVSQSDPAIDYLAKDFDSFRHTMIVAISQRVPGWQPSSEADLDQVLLELFSASADELSDYQDRVMNEAYLGAARKRVSLARHARLMDYHIHQGNQANTWLAVKIAEDEIFVMPKGFLVGTENGINELNNSSGVVFMTRKETPILFSVSQVFQTDLDSNNISNDFRNQFERQNITLSLDVTAAIKQEDSQWLITDNNNFLIFYVKKDNDDNKLNIYAPDMHHLLNEINLYTWNDSIPSLAAGSTTADLKFAVNDGMAAKEAAAKFVQNLINNQHIQYLLIQEWRDPETGREAGRNPAKRQLLKLLSDAEALEDPVTKEWFVRVRWEEQDKLKYNYCFYIECKYDTFDDVSLFHGNLVEVYHGRPSTTVFLDPEIPLTGENHYHYQRTRWGTICKLPDNEPLLYENTPPGGEETTKSSLEVTVTVDGTNDPWDEVISLIHSDDTSEGGDHFVVETDEEGRSLIRFGNGVNGRQLSDKARVNCQHQVGLGLEGNVGADTLIYFQDTGGIVKSVWNPFDVTNGRAPEPVAEIVRRVPEAYRYRQLRAVTLQDYVDRAQQLPEVSQAAARYAWTGSWRTVQVAIDPLGTTTLPDDLRQKITRHLDAVRLLGEDLEVRAPEFVPLEIHVSVCIKPDYWAEDIQFYLEQEFADGYTRDGRMGFFHPDRWTFGQELHASQIQGRVQAIVGVDHVISVTMKRWNAPTPGTDKIANLRPNEIILVRNNPDQMELGFIKFDIKGGRR